MDPGPSPTVVVSRTPVAGNEEALATWLDRLVAAARRAPGHVADDIQPPSPSHPDDWVVVYRFTTRNLLDAWLDSPTRRQLMDDGEPFVAQTSAQLVAMTPETDSVTAVSSITVLPGFEDAYHRAHVDVAAGLLRQPGFLRTELFPAVPGVQRETVTTLTFRDRATLDAWLASDDRRVALATFDGLVEGDRTVNVVGAFGGWFDLPSPSVRTWKQAAVVLAALFPVSLALTILRLAVLPDLPLLPAVFVGNTLGVAILSWLLMPPLTRWLDPWLRR